MGIASSTRKSVARTFRPVSAFYLTGNIEKYGSGFIRIRKALEDHPEVRPV
jgi:ATP-dependent DNA helicase RecG